jgi:Delta7-sterol 5-desaturase
MDIALELCDKYFFDYLYAAALPLLPPANLNFGAGNSSGWDPKAASSWHFKPASELLSFQPTEAAYLSQWTRDNVYRQNISLYIITL